MIEFIIEVVLEIIIYGIFDLIKKIYYNIRKALFGIPKPEDPKVKLENQYLYKNIILTKNLNSLFQKGKKGTIVEILNKDNFIVEFRDEQSEPIEFNNEFVHLLKKNQIKLVE